MLKVRGCQTKMNDHNRITAKKQYNVKYNRFGIANILRQELLEIKIGFYNDNKKK